MAVTVQFDCGLVDYLVIKATWHDDKCGDDSGGIHTLTAWGYIQREHARFTAMHCFHETRSCFLLVCFVFCSTALLMTIFTHRHCC